MFVPSLPWYKMIVLSVKWCKTRVLVPPMTYMSATGERTLSSCGGLCENAFGFKLFPFVCSEPVLVKRSCFIRKLRKQQKRRKGAGLAPAKVHGDRALDNALNLLVASNIRLRDGRLKDSDVVPALGGLQLAHDRDRIRGVLCQITFLSFPYVCPEPVLVNARVLV